MNIFSVLTLNFHTFFKNINHAVTIASDNNIRDNNANTNQLLSVFVNFMLLSLNNFSVKAVTKMYLNHHHG